MIQKPQTSEVMDILDSSQAALINLRSQIDDVKNGLNDKLAVLSNQYEYSMSKIIELKECGDIVSNKILLANVETYGSYDKYGLTVHQKLVSTPRNLFNFRATNGFVFKNNVSVKLNGEETPKFLECLKHDTIAGKNFYIQEFNTDTIEIEIIPDSGNTLGSLSCNCIELQPLLSGSFNIEAIEVYESGNTVYPVHKLVGIEHVGPCRLVLDEKVEISKIVFSIKLLFQNSIGNYPFGIKHLYFLDANFRNDSYIIARITETENISYIYDDIIYKNQYGIDTSAKCSDKDIKFYTTFDGDDLSHEIEVSTETDPSYLAINTKSCYIKIPVKTSIIAITPHIVTGNVELEII